MVVGAVGSGKSSVISAILGELEPVKGTVELMSSAKVSYVAQGAWLMNATLRENITFVSEYQQHKYDAVVEAAGLLQDLEELPDSDQTEIGEVRFPIVLVLDNCRDIRFHVLTTAGL